MSVLATTQIEGMDPLLSTLTDIRYSRARKMVDKILVEGAKPLRAAIQTEAPVGPSAASRKQARAAARAAKQKPPPGNLKAGVRYKASAKSTGALAYMVGPFGAGTQHRHLVVRGHVITGHDPDRVRGGRTKANPFVYRGAEKGRQQAFDAIAAAAKTAVDNLTKP